MYPYRERVAAKGARRQQTHIVDTHVRDIKSSSLKAEEAAEDLPKVEYYFVKSC